MIQMVKAIIEIFADVNVVVCFFALKELIVTDLSEVIFESTIDRQVLKRGKCPKTIAIYVIYI